MSQKRYINFGTTADAGKVKAINRNLFAPQVLRSDSPFMSVASANQIELSPHAVLFNNGTVLEEDESTIIDIETGFSSLDVTIYYEHVDEDQIGGAAAVLDTTPGLLPSVTNGVVLGWVKYPGGSVAIDSSMLFPNFQGQVVAGSQFKEIIKPPTHGIVIATSDVLDSSNPSSSLGNTIPGSPYQLTLPEILLSKRLASESDQHIRVFSRDDGSDMSRVTTSPSAGEFSVNLSTGIFTFNSADSGKVVDVSDITYGGDLIVTENSSAASATEDVVFTFPTFDVQIKTISFEYVVLEDYTIDLVEVIDSYGAIATTIVDKTEPTSPDGSISRIMVRLLSGSFEGVNGQQFVARIRKTVGAGGEGIFLGARASVYDLPF